MLNSREVTPNIDPANISFVTLTSALLFGDLVHYNKNHQKKTFVIVLVKLFAVSLYISIDRMVQSE